MPRALEIRMNHVQNFSILPDHISRPAWQESQRLRYAKESAHVAAYI